jgi:hypothetical protein
MGDFVSIAAIVLLVLLGPWVLVWRVNSRRKRERAEDQERWRELTSRTYALEQMVRALQAQRSSRSGPTAEEATPRTSESPVATSYAPPSPPSTVVSPPPVPPVVDHTAEPSPSVRVAERWVTQKTIEPAAPYSSTTDRLRLLLRQSHNCLRRVSPQRSLRRRWPAGSNHHSMSKRCWARTGSTSWASSSLY